MLASVESRVPLIGGTATAFATRATRRGLAGMDGKRHAASTKANGKGVDMHSELRAFLSPPLRRLMRMACALACALAFSTVPALVLAQTIASPPGPTAAQQASMARTLERAQAGTS